MLSRIRIHWRSGLALAAAVASLVAVPAASAASWSWTGTFSSTNPVPFTGPCVWTLSGKGQACSGWYAWNVSAFDPGSGQCVGDMYTGFQNNDRIRGEVYTPICGATAEVHPSDLSMSGTLIAQSAYWDGAATQGTAWATG
jgi:hypothetical protein